MPDEIVSDDLHVVIETKLDVSISRVEGVAVGSRLRRLELQHVLGADLVELRRDQADGGDVGALELPLVDGDADHHPLWHQVLQRDILVCRRGENGETGGRIARRPVLAGDELGGLGDRSGIRAFEAGDQSVAGRVGTLRGH